MHHVVHIIADHGQLWRHFPIVATYGTDTTVLFGDHRNSITERADALNRVLPLNQITSVERVLIDPIDVDCRGGVHDWVPVGTRTAISGGRCQACGYTEWLPEPVPAYANFEPMSVKRAGMTA